MREIRQSGSEGGEGLNSPSLPLSRKSMRWCGAVHPAHLVHCVQIIRPEGQSIERENHRMTVASRRGCWREFLDNGFGRSPSSS